jgi:catechol 2,3-dioxygenase-like lactoylglutathione lyase family enzyme
MINLQRTHHIGMAVADIEQAQAQIGAAMGLTFAPVRNFDPLPFWTPERGKHEVNVFATYSIEGPTRIELVQGTGEFYDPNRAPDARHIGVWVDDLKAEAERLAAQGWTTVASGDAPENGWGVIAYMAPPIPGLLVELISTDLKPVIDKWLGDA